VSRLLPLSHLSAPHKKNIILADLHISQDEERGLDHPNDLHENPSGETHDQSPPAAQQELKDGSHFGRSVIWCGWGGPVADRRARGFGFDEIHAMLILHLYQAS
jgi:hypothetical protein